MPDNKMEVLEDKELDTMILPIQKISRNDDEDDGRRNPEEVDTVDDNTDQLPSLLLTLPTEMWSMILEYVPQPDRVHHRLVSREWCKSIDESSSFKIVYGNVPQTLRQHVFNLRIRACEFSGLKDEIDLEFAHPLLLKEITFGPWVSAENCKKILSLCSNVESLKIFATEKSDTYFQDTLNPLSYLKNLKMLRSIEIGLLYFGRRDPTAISPTFSTLVGTKDLVFPALSNVVIQCQMTKKEWVEFMHFLGRHAKTVREMSILQCICSSVNVSLTGEENSNAEEPVLANLSCITSYIIMKSSSCECNGDFLWSKLISAKSGIQKLWTNLVPSTTVICDFVNKHHHSLRSVKLYDVSLGVDATMDVSIFQQCAQLQELTLHFLSCSVIVIHVREIGCGESPISKKYSEISGLQFLPKSLRKLSIKGCDIMSSTIMDTSSKLTNLLEFDVGDPGSPSRVDHGVSIEIMLSLLKNMSGLKKFRVHENSINQPVENGVEWEKINSVFRSYNLIDANFPDLPQMGNSDASDFLINLDFTKFYGSRCELLDRLQTELKNTG